MDSRAVSPVVEKTVAIGLVVLFVSGFSGTLLTGTVPDYRADTGRLVGERILATAADAVESAVPTTNGTVSVQVERELPATVAGSEYAIELRGRTLRLEHPDPSIRAEIQLALTDGVSARDSRWRGGPFRVRVDGPAGNRSLSIGGE